ncbi:type VII secretion integral membrane protein EccD [Couchioplanes caeruleus]|uniref:Type VII secretion integral membrane protein EccD n=2 Tax=Couchioplanes caeruleus TaxID=56438 RepID=A0A1K0FLF0_9ACTN|nr:type VII secretion integral membrane protein EccD [Couchioplanes caeruleus]OJF13633.1 type VII secretion integral membrane protein EccD [Couchioplanes caeruleus subsp. caeruleus]ROP31519.1 type VII secretion integral membrane protein EccD [Couchioplanes caeruleus]
MSIGLARITISAPSRRVDVALPEHVPLVELLPEVLRHAGEGLADDGEKHGGWVLRRTDGVALATAQGLFPQGVRDGEVLHLVPAREEWPELEYDDVVEAIAEGARRRGTVWSAAATRTATLAAAAVLLSLGLFAVLTAGPGWGGAAFAGLGVALLLTLAGITASRAYGDARAGAALGGLALPYAFAGGAVLVGQGVVDRAGVFPLLPWLGGPELLAGSAAVLLFAALGGVGVAASLRIFAAGVTVGLLGALTALTGLLTTAAGAAAVLMSLLVCGIGTLPLLAIRFGKLPTPPVTLPTGTDAEQGFTAARPAGDDAARELPDRRRVFVAVSRTEELLTGMLIGHAVLAAGAFVVLASSDGMAARILTGLAVAALLLRSRLFVTLRQRVPLLVGGLFGAFVLGVDLLVGAGEVMLLGLSVAGLLLAVATVAAGASWSRRAPSPYLGRAADLLDGLAVIAVIPVACSVVGLYGLVSTISI